MWGLRGSNSTSLTWIFCDTFFYRSIIRLHVMSHLSVVKGGNIFLTVMEDFLLVTLQICPNYILEGIYKHILRYLWLGSQLWVVWQYCIPEWYSSFLKKKFSLDLEEELKMFVNKDISFPKYRWNWRLRLESMLKFQIFFAHHIQL